MLAVLESTEYNTPLTVEKLAGQAFSEKFTHHYPN